MTSNEKNIEPYASLTQIPEINLQLTKFKEELLGILSESEARINAKINSIQLESLESQSKYATTITSVSTKYDEIAQSISNVNNKFDRLTQYEAFSRKANDQITTHEIRINNISKDLTKACYKYDKMYLDNLILPGFIGDCCKYKNCKEFFDDMIGQVSVLNNHKEKQTVDLRSYKERLESVIKSFNSQVDTFNKNSMKYTNESIKESEERAKGMFDDVYSQINELGLQNSRYSVEIKKQSKDLTEEWEKMLKIKDEIYGKFDIEVSNFRKVHGYTIGQFDTVKQKFSKIKHRFAELAEFIKDVRFRKNLQADVKKREITTLVKKIDFKRKSFEELPIDVEKLKEKAGIEEPKKNPLRNSQSHEIESRIKGYINGETDAEHLKKAHNMHRVAYQNEHDENNKEIINISIDTNDKIIHELGPEFEQSNNKNFTIQEHPNQQSQDQEDHDEIPDTRRPKSSDESPMPTQTYSNQQVNGSLKGDKEVTTQRHYSINSVNQYPLSNQFDLKKEQKQLDKKITYTEKKVFDLEAFTKQKITELSNQVTLLLNSSGINVNLNGIIQSVSVGQGQAQGQGQNGRSNSNSLPKNKNKKYETQKDHETSLNIANKMVPVSVVDLVSYNKNQLPFSQNMAPLRHKQLKSRVRTGREQIDRMFMQALGANFDDAIPNTNTVYPRDPNHKITVGTSATSTNLPDYRVLKKIERKQIIDCGDLSKIQPTRWVPLQKVLTNVPHMNNQNNESDQ